MSITRVTAANCVNCRIERLLRAQRCLRVRSAQRIEIAKAIDELQSGYPTAHTKEVERWAAEYLDGLL